MERTQTLAVQENRIVKVPREEPSNFKPNGISTCKYNLLTFIPKNLWLQFQKLANVYFLAIAVLQVIPQISVSGGIPNILLPLLFVLTLSAIKDLLEDLKRRRADKEENSRIVEYWTNDGWKLIAWKKLHVGDIVKVKKNEYFPTDLVLLTSSESSGICYIETKNLDGETNLKHKLSLKQTHKIFTEAGEGVLNRFETEIKCEDPNAMIYQFKGTILINGVTIPITPEQFLLRGSSLRNTDWIIGISVYTGHETKIMLNSSNAQSKFSAVEHQMNRQVVYIFLMQCCICLFGAVFYTIWFEVTEDDTEQYLDLDDETQSGVVIFILIFFSWMLIFTNFVPISLIVTLEMVRFLQAIWISWDLKIYYEPTDTPAGVQSSNLNEELGQIHYVFSDKTGTLTCNVMEFRKFCIDGKSYGTNSRTKIDKQPNVDFVDPNFDRKSEKAIEFFTNLAVCHTVVTEKHEDGTIEYKASSPDEQALVCAAKYFGVELLGRDREQSVIVNVNGKEQLYKILNVIEFTSNRKRMSVIARYPNGKIYLLCKGADTVILPRLRQGQNLDAPWKYLESYACEGLRTLVITFKEISEEDYEAWNTEFIEAMNNLENREKLTAQLAERIEQDLELIGITAIEDKLQDGVPSTIAMIREAGIKIWLLTGDKIETAVNIGYSCALLTNEMIQATVDGNSTNTVKYQLQEALATFRLETAKYALIISGDALLRIAKPELIRLFLKCVDYVEVVLACRVSPQQKAQLVKLIKDTKPKVRTLSIGDGANDVNMILAAHVGVGIAGVEGKQAVRAADYSIAQFSYLKRLLFVHGRECYRKNTNLICYNFYKNVLLVMPLFFYGLFSAYSGQILYNMWTYQLFNVFYAASPIIIYAIFDKDYDYENLETTPSSYKLGLIGDLFSTKVFWLWIVEAVLQAMLILFVAVLAICYYTGDEDYGRVNGMWVASDLVYSLVVIIVNLKIFLFSFTQYWFSILAIFGSIATYYLTSLILTMWLPIINWFDNYDGRGSTEQMFENPNTYSSLVLCIIGAFLFLPIISHIKEMVDLLKPSPPYYEEVEKDEKKEEEEQFIEEEELPLSTYTPLLTRRHTGFAFSQEAGHVPQITDPDFYQSKP
ncbi:unnamed protein product [Blepharisma stoltei]|uniref:Phospholipid-transporting ATPase n=1 Tax=Blepharisma stoltei TaxID=1481888 RepID=A0AAU9JKP9_9CILI|nr:unnamed protein product [Blepharisma stoltei]